MAGVRGDSQGSMQLIDTQLMIRKWRRTVTLNSDTDKDTDSKVEGGGGEDLGNSSEGGGGEDLGNSSR